MQEKKTLSSLTMPLFPSYAQNSNNRREELVSIQCVSFIENENGNHLSRPQQPTGIPLTPNKNPYDSDGEEGQLFNAVLNEIDYCSSNEEVDEPPQSLVTIQPMPQTVLRRFEAPS